MTQTNTLAGVITVEQRVVRKVLTTDPPLTFTITVEYVPEDNGFGAWCEEMEAAGWAKQWRKPSANWLKKCEISPRCWWKTMTMTQHFVTHASSMPAI